MTLILMKNQYSLILPVYMFMQAVSQISIA